MRVRVPPCLLWPKPNGEALGCDPSQGVRFPTVTPSTLSKMGQRFHDTEEKSRFDSCSVHSCSGFEARLPARQLVTAQMVACTRFKSLLKDRPRPPKSGAAGSIPARDTKRKHLAGVVYRLLPLPSKQMKGVRFSPPAPCSGRRIGKVL